ALLKKNKLKATIFTEPDGRDIKTGGENPEIYGSIDPFDGSVLFLRGFEHNWYIALSFFDIARNPIVCGIADILNEKLYITENSGNYMFDIKKGKKIPIFPSERKTIAEPVVLASYMMSSQYSAKFLDIFGDFIRGLHPKALLYPQGGSFIYAFLASGLVDAYIMFNEPRSEIDPGFYIAKKAGFQILSVDAQGNYKDYEFLPGKQHDKVDFLVAVLSPQIRDVIINHYLLQVKKRT
ncbi:MAG: inositol monophosphatase family protein, partial [bacterium]|nr:inositol monophosphatase family protein [bacterium]